MRLYGLTQVFAKSLELEKRKAFFDLSEDEQIGQMDGATIQKVMMFKDILQKAQDNCQAELKL